MDIVDLLDQEEIWVDRAGVEHEIAEMEPRYCANVVRFLLRQAEAIAHADSMAILSVRMPDFDTIAYDDVMSGIGVDEAAKADPVRWLQDKPLLRALRARLSGGAS